MRIDIVRWVRISVQGCASDAYKLSVDSRGTKDPDPKHHCEKVTFCLKYPVSPLWRNSIQLEQS
jgi:hypothetical protein